MEKSLKDKLIVNCTISVFCVLCAYVYLSTEELSWKLTEWHRYNIYALIVAFVDMAFYAVAFSLFTERLRKQ